MLSGNNFGKICLTLQVRGPNKLKVLLWAECIRQLAGVIQLMVQYKVIDSVKGFLGDRFINLKMVSETSFCQI